MNLMKLQNYHNDQGACLCLFLDPKQGPYLDLFVERNCYLEIDHVAQNQGIDYRFVITSKIASKQVQKVSATWKVNSNKPCSRFINFTQIGGIFSGRFTFGPDDLEHSGNLSITVWARSMEQTYQFYYTITNKSVPAIETKTVGLCSTKRETKTSNEYFTIDPSYTPSHDKLLKNQRGDPIQEIRHHVDDLKKKYEEVKSELSNMKSFINEIKEFPTTLIELRGQIGNKVDRGEIQLLHEEVKKQEKEIERFKQPDFSTFITTLKKSFEAKAQALIQEALSPSAPSDAARPIQALQQLFQNPQSPAPLLLQKDSRFSPPIQKIATAIQGLYQQAFPSAETVTPPDFTVPMNYSGFCQSPQYESIFQSDPSRFYDPAVAYRHFVHASFQETLKRFKPGSASPSDQGAAVIEKLHKYVAERLLDDLRALEDAERAVAMDCPEASALVSEFFRQFLNELGLEPYEAKAGDLFIAGKFLVDRNAPVSQKGKVKRTVQRGIRYKENPERIWNAGLVIVE